MGTALKLSQLLRRAAFVGIEPLEQRQLLSVTPLPTPAGSVKLTGALIGTIGSYQNKGNTIAKAIDGNTATFFDAPVGVDGWVDWIVVLMAVRESALPGIWEERLRFR